MKQFMQRMALGTTIALCILLAITVAVTVLVPGPAPAIAQTVGTYTVHRVADGSTPYTTAGGNLTGWEVDDYGAVVVQVVSDASNTTSTLTITPQYSLWTGTPCSDVSNWFTGVDYIAYSSPAQYGVVQHVPISYTVNSTSSLALAGTESLLSYMTNYTDSLAWTSVGSTTITGNAPYVVSSTYTYGSPGASLTGSVPYVITTTYTYGTPSVVTYTLAAATAGYVGVNQTLALTGDTYGGRQFATYGRCMRLNIAVSYGTITPTIYVMDRDVTQ